MTERIIVGADGRKYITTEPDPRNYVDRRQWKYDPMTGEPLIDGWPLYSGLPQREWQGLTDEERDEICLGDEAISRAIEAKLKEKNYG